MITVLGLGFVGLTTALGFCEKGFSVFGYDTDNEKVANLREGVVPFHEDFLVEKLTKYHNKNFTIVNDLNEAVSQSKVIFFCMGTPNNKDGSADLSFIFNAIKSIAKYLNKQVLVIKSTVPPSSTKDIIKPFIEKLGLKVGKDIGLTNNPEFLREGYAWDDFLKPDRIVIGEDDEKSGKVIEELYQSFNAPIYRVSLTTAEYIKYLSNTLLATLISFANEQSMIGKEIGDVDVKKAFDILHLDKRWYGSPANMAKYVFPGCGFGGYCLPKDTEALIARSLRQSYSPDILLSVLKVNEKIKDYVVRDILNRTSKEDYIGILGLSFKPNSDDVRDTPALEIIKKLLSNNYKNIIAYDPLAIGSFKKAYNLPITYSGSLRETVNNSSHLIILTAWNEFVKNNEMINQKNVLDYRYFLE